MNYSLKFFVFAVITTSVFANVSPTTSRESDAAGSGSTTINQLNRSGTSQKDAVNLGPSTFEGTTGSYDRRSASLNRTNKEPADKAAERTPPDNRGSADNRNIRSNNNSSK